MILNIIHLKMFWVSNCHLSLFRFLGAGGDYVSPDCLSPSLQLNYYQSRYVALQQFKILVLVQLIKFCIRQLFFSKKATLNFWMPIEINILKPLLGFCFCCYHHSVLYQSLYQGCSNSWTLQGLCFCVSIGYVHFFTTVFLYGPWPYENLLVK